MTSLAIAPRMAHDVIGNVGNTPLLRLEKIGANYPGVEIYAKAEYFNPGGSVKDRPALNIVLEAERSGKLTKDKTLIDATSGNTGIAYAMIGAARGFKVKLCLPLNASIERKRILKAYGAELVLTPADEGSDGKSVEIMAPMPAPAESEGAKMPPGTPLNQVTRVTRILLAPNQTGAPWPSMINLAAP